MSNNYFTLLLLLFLYMYMEIFQVFIYIHAYYFLEQGDTHPRHVFGRRNYFHSLSLAPWISRENSTWPLINKLIIN